MKGAVFTAPFSCGKEKSMLLKIMDNAKHINTITLTASKNTAPRRVAPARAATRRPMYEICAG